MNKSRLLGAACAWLFTFINMPANAGLVGVLPATPGGSDWQAFYDDVAELTWLANANAGAGSVFDDIGADGGTTTDGEMTWENAVDWTASLDINGVTGWRLPDTLQPDSSCDLQTALVSSGWNCTGSELGNLFYNVLGGTAHVSITAAHNSNYDLFSGIQSDIYWSATDYAPIPGEAWIFTFGSGKQDNGYKPRSYHAWAVYSGNAGAVPIPAAVYLFGSGLLGLVGMARRKNK